MRVQKKQALPIGDGALMKRGFNDLQCACETVKKVTDSWLSVQGKAVAGDGMQQGKGQAGQMQ